MSRLRRTFFDPKKLFTEVQTMEFQISQAFSHPCFCGDLLRSHDQTSKFSRHSSLWFCCLVVRLLHALKWLNMNISIF